MYINGPERINALKIQDLAFNSCMTRNTSTCKNSEKSYRRFSFQAKFVNTASRGVDLTQHCNLDHKFLSRPLPKVAMGFFSALVDRSFANFSELFWTDRGTTCDTSAVLALPLSVLVRYTGPSRSAAVMARRKLWQIQLVETSLFLKRPWRPTVTLFNFKKLDFGNPLQTGNPATNIFKPENRRNIEKLPNFALQWRI